jgi:hypothetical protein
MPHRTADAAASRNVVEKLQMVDVHDGIGVCGTPSPAARLTRCNPVSPQNFCAREARPVRSSAPVMWCIKIIN